jgi:hypothetical protein
MLSVVHQFYAMASDCAVHLWGKTAEHLELFAEAEVGRIETRYSRYRDDSEISRSTAVCTKPDLSWKNSLIHHKSPLE